MKNRLLATLFMTIACFPSALVAEFGVTLKTTQSETTDTLTTRLYNQGAPAGPGVGPSEKDDPVWLIFDVDGGGVFQPGALTGINYDGTIADLLAKMIQPGDHVIQSTVPGPIAGRLNRSFTGLPSFLQTGGTGLNDSGGTVRPAVAILFDSPDLSNGGTFGFRTTVASGLIPDIGNVSLRIHQDVYADTYTFSSGSTPTPPTLGNPTVLVSGGNVVFSFFFLAETGTSSQVQSATNLIHPITWINEGGVILGNGVTTNISVTTAASEALQKFFRVRVD